VNLRPFLGFDGQKYENESGILSALKMDFKGLYRQFISIELEVLST
jgi:hypothetical protein